jgi:hypothetical protein
MLSIAFDAKNPLSGRGCNWMAVSKKYLVCRHISSEPSRIKVTLWDSTP